MSVDRDVFVLVPSPRLAGVMDIVPLVELVGALSEYETLDEALDNASIDMTHDDRGLLKMIEKVRAFNDTGDLYAFHGITPPEPQESAPERGSET